MSRTDFINSPVRSIPVERREILHTEYMEAYSFVLSYGWRMRSSIDEEGAKVFYWEDTFGSRVDTVYDARDVQHLRLIQDSP